MRKTAVDGKLNSTAEDREVKECLSEGKRLRYYIQALLRSLGWRVWVYLVLFTYFVWYLLLVGRGGEISRPKGVYEGLDA